jgi:hypothetical protein
MLAGHGGELVFGIITFLTAIVFVWAVMRLSAAGAAAREADQSRQESQRQP